jgi:primosomal protein N'
MFYYEVLVADTKYHSSAPLTYSSEEKLAPLSVVTVPLRSRAVTGFVMSEVGKPGFAAKPIKSLLSPKPLPYHCLELAQWMADYYAVPLSESLRLFPDGRAKTGCKGNQRQPQHYGPTARRDRQRQDPSLPGAGQGQP